MKHVGRFCRSCRVRRRRIEEEERRAEEEAKKKEEEKQRKKEKEKVRFFFQSFDHFKSYSLSVSTYRRKKN